MGSVTAEGDRLEEEVFIFPASFAQQRLWFIDQLIPGASLYNVPLVFRLTGKLDPTALEQSFNRIIDRHEVLRTTFDEVNGQLVQVITSTLNLTLAIVNLQALSATTREETAIAQIREQTQQPFDLQQGPLLRVQLLQLSPTDHLLLINLHHIIFDEWSSGVLIRELGTFYTALVQHQTALLPELPIQYADFAHWQQQWLQGDVLNQQLSYWRQQLKALPTLNLPGNARPTGLQRHQGAIELIELPQALLNDLEALSQQAGVTLFMTLLAAFQTLLYRYTGQSDLAVGSPIANRHRSELENLIGFFVNSLVLRTDLSGNPTFLELLERVREVTLAAYAHQDLPFEKLVEELQPTRNLSHNPLFQVVFALQNTPMDQLELPELTLSPVEFETKTTRFDLELYLWKCTGNFRSLWGTGWQQIDGLRGVLVYNTDLFAAEAIVRLRQHFQTLLEGIVADPEMHLAALPILTEAELQQLQDWNQTQTDDPMTLTIHRRFEQQVQQQPTTISVQSAHQQFTYQQLNQGSNQLARYLQKLGVGSETLVALCLESLPETVAAMLAILKAGGAYLPLDPTHPPERLRFMLEDAQVAVVLTQQQWINRLETGNAKVICLEQHWPAIATENDENLDCPITAEQLAYVIYTSGSTGTPKGVAVPHRAVNRLVCQTNYIQLQPSDHIAQVANLAFDAATFEIWGALLNGAQLIGIPRDSILSPADFVAQLQQQQISVLFLTTALFNQIVSQQPAAFQALRYLLFGGEMVDVNRVRQVLQHGKPQHLLHVYGPTENTTFSTAYEVQEISETATMIPIGRAISNTQIYILDAQLNPVPIGISGEIYLSGAGLAKGYLNRPDVTAEKFIVTPPLLHSPTPVTLYKTGDLARYRSDGTLEFLGRIDDQIKLRGFRIELGEIESVLSQHPVVKAAIVTVHEIEGNQRLIAYLVCAAPTPTQWELRRFLEAKLPAYMVPAAFVMLDALPLTPNGKVDRRALPLFLPTATETISTVAPQTSVEKTLAEIWGRLLGREQVGIHDNFFELGGHSLLATQLISRIRDTFQVEVSLRRLFEVPTIAGLVQNIEATKGTKQASVDRTGQREEVEL